MTEQASGVCQCHLTTPSTRTRAAPERKASRPLLTTALSISLAFIPRCPVCWSTYMSMFGSVWLARTPYVAWLYPVLIGLSGLNLLALKRASKNGHGPFLLGLAGTVVVLGGRALVPQAHWLVFAGMAAMIASSLIASVTTARLDLFTSHAVRKEGHS